MSDAQKILISQCFEVMGRIGHSYYVPSTASEAPCSMYSGTPGDHLGDPSSIKPTLFPRPSSRAEGLTVAFA